MVEHVKPKPFLLAIREIFNARRPPYLKLEKLDSYASCVSKVLSGVGVT